MKLKGTFLLALIGSLALASCGGNEKPAPTSKPTESPTTEETTQPTTTPSTEDTTKPATGTKTEESTKLKDFNLTLEDETVTYDGEEHSLALSGTIPEGAKVVYTGNAKVDAGTYKVKANVTMDGYNPLSLEANLIINKATFTGITYEDTKVEYDGEPHKIVFSGNLPEGSTFTYSSNIEGKTNEFVEAGEYEVKLTIKNPNFNDYVVTKKLTIESKLDDLYSIYYNDTLYFQNALDKDKLYAYMSDGTLKRISSDKCQYFTVFDNNIYYRSDSLIQPSISRLNPAVNKCETAAPINASELVSDGEYIYYIAKDFLKNKGIYRMSYGNNGEPVTECIYTGKAKNLALVGDKLYFSNGENKNYLSYVNKSLTNQTTATVLIENKINNIYQEGNSIFFTVNEALGDYIMQYTPSTNKLVKLTSDAAGSMVVIGDYLYYTNVDKLNTIRFGKGVSRVKINQKANSSLAGERILKDANKDYELTSLQTDGTNLYFYRVFDKKVYSYNPNTDELTDLLADFVKPEEVVLFKSGKSIEYNGNIYFNNVYDGDKLYRYEVKTGNLTRLTSAAVDDLYVYNDYLYYRQVSYLVNKDLYRMNLKVSEAPKLISENDCGELEIINDRIYYVNYSGNNTINSMNLDGSDDKVIYEKEAYNLRAYKDKLYFIQNGLTGDYIYSMDLNDLAKAPVKFEDCKTTSFEIHNDEIYFRKIFKVNKCLAKVKLDGTGYEEILKDCDPESFAFNGNKIYYYNDVSSNYGIFEFDLVTKENKRLAKEYASSLIYLDGYIYYYNYTTGVFGDSHFKRLNLKDNKLELLAQLNYGRLEIASLFFQ